MNTTKIRGISFLPILNLALFLVTLGVSSMLAKRQDGVWVTTLPYISDTGALPPASCYFTLLLNATAYSLMATGFLRFFETQHRLKQSRNTVYPGWFRPLLNFFSLLLITCGCIGIAMVAAFQETNVGILHRIGALCAFAAGAVYTLIQCFFSMTFVIEEMSGPSLAHKIIVGIRIVLSATCCISFMLMQIFMPRSGSKLPPHHSGTFNDTLIATTDEPPYDDKVAYYFTTVDEWILGVSMFTYIATLSYDFWKLEASISVECKDIIYY